MTALRTNDLEAYARLVRAAKSERLTQLLGQTDACLRKLTSRLRCLCKSAGADHAAPPQHNRSTPAAEGVHTPPCKS